MVLGRSHIAVDGPHNLRILLSLLLPSCSVLRGDTTPASPIFRLSIPGAYPELQSGY